MSILDDLQAAWREATADESAARLAGLGDRGTSGPGLDDHPLILNVPPAGPEFVDGWWREARRVDAHPGRVGPPIDPRAIGLHSTDMPPEDWEALVASWTGRAGDGACAQFLLGRDEAQGTLQLCPITRNGNHLGGPGHGVFVIGGHEVHPNTVAVGIELHCAGGVRLVNGLWRFAEGGIAHGKPIPAADVIADPARPGRGWHVITDYQRAQATKLIGALHRAMRPLPSGTITRAFGEVPPRWAVMPSARLVTHAQMDPVHRADPWPKACEWLAREIVPGLA